MAEIECMICGGTGRLVPKIIEPNRQWYECDECGGTGYRYVYLSSAGETKKSSDGGCYITTAVCSAVGRGDDCLELQTLRKFRDDYVLKTESGQELVEEYYQTAPDLVERVNAREDSREVYRRVYDEYLSRVIEEIELGNNGKAGEIYIAMANYLKRLLN